MYPAWDVTHKKPLFFSSNVVEHEIKGDPNSVYSMSYTDMILASASNPTYFAASEIEYGTDKKSS